MELNHHFLFPIVRLYQKLQGWISKNQVKNYRAWFYLNYTDKAISNEPDARVSIGIQKRARNFAAEIIMFEVIIIRVQNFGKK